MCFGKESLANIKCMKNICCTSIVDPNVDMSFLSALVCVLAVAVVVATEMDTPQRVCVGLKADEGQQGFDCIQCNSITCINNVNDSTHIQFVSKTFILEDTLQISNREGIHLEGTAKPETRITCTEQSQKQIGLEFTNIQNLTIVNITVESCGMRSQKVCPGRHRFPSAIYLIHCTHVYISGMRVLQNVGSGLAIIDTNGTVTVEESVFENNGVSEVPEVVGAGGLYVQFSSCFPSPQSAICSQQWSLNTTYAFTDCNFTSNNANISESDTSFDYEKRLLGRGGGLGIILSDGATNNRITLTRCWFLNNTATWGGGMHVWFKNTSLENLLVVRDCNFKNNNCPKRAGGAINIEQDNHSFKGDQVMFEDTKFVENSAGYGGGVGLLSSPMTILFTFNKCSWERNKAHLSSALDVLFKTSEGFPHGYRSQVILSDCLFINNAAINHEIKANSSQQYKEAKGAMVVTAHSVQFEGKTTFRGNNGTALYLVTSTAIFAPNSTVLFEGNSGLQGGAIALIGLSAIYVQQNSRFTFRNKHAYTQSYKQSIQSYKQRERKNGKTNFCPEHRTQA